MTRPRRSPLLTVPVSLLTVGFVTGLLVPLASAQDQPPAPPAGPGEGAAEGQQGSITVVPIPVPAAPAPQVQIPGYPAPGTDPNGHLPSSSRGTTDTSRSTDGFDFGSKGGGPSSVRGGANGAYVTEGGYVPDTHTVRRGDTLWDISGRYYQNPYNWPRVWAYNPQVQNPHWIYPGDRIRLRDGGDGKQFGGGFGFGNRRAAVPPETVFLRDVGWVDDPKEDAWGEISGAPDDQMLLSENDDVYIQLKSEHDVTLGQELTVWQPLHVWRSDGGSGMLVSIRGTARIERYNPRTHTVKAKLIESIDIIERGARVGPVGRRFDIVPPVTNEQDVEARLIASVYPYQLYGKDQVVFINKGEKDGLKPGNRLFAVRRGDLWRDNLGMAGVMATKRPRIEDQRAAEVDEMPEEGDKDLYPDETYAELRVIRVKEHTATALVTASMHEVERNARLYARKGY